MLVKGAVRTDSVAERNVDVDVTDHQSAPATSHSRSSSVKDWESRLGRKLLKGVSRSFYVTLRLLNPEIRGPVSLAYLLARASDTLADTESLPVPLRLDHLEAYRECVRTGKGWDSVQSRIEKEITPLQKHEGEIELMNRVADCGQWLACQEAFHLEAIQNLLESILHGQMLDCERFDGGFNTLETADELDKYTYLVAGSVGEFWTRVGFHDVKAYARLDEAEMLRRGRSYGKGLQLINILRDHPKDLTEGRCYFPRDDWGGDGSIRPDRAALEPVLEQWRARAFSRMGDGFSYCLALNSPRLRFATVLPVLIGVRTLVMLEQADWETFEKGVKVSRKEVKRILFQTWWRQWSRPALERYYRRLLDR
ncbi:MAG: squalene/phytoene synthase family protein [Verrucomicrobiota bacterium]